MVDYQRSQYPIYDHHYMQGHIPPDHVHPSWYTPSLSDFGYIYSDVGGASTSFCPGVQGDDEDDDNDEEEGNDDDNDESGD
jgi:hypothetical protein